ncbi:response regulator receiver protein [Clostridium aceticum]|uniref:Stage 0 sporulation protein A homolog n=1 Tax=Clostridium aceticum TaxID=84022 RepID=A0A0D8IH32_9CLOT|nr:response regulator [Clostridium aceticum]AKL94181.1 response regulator receiver protein [Clostridium aceticum]KJF28476.1 histidine kinase [Clostridium aceticum]
MEEINALSQIKVLYVEDEAITRNQVYRFLKKRVGKVIAAENGEDGINKFLEFQPDIIITDLIMPDINGIEMMKKLRTDGFRCPFIITSALSDTKTILETVDLKIEKYLIKPIDADVLMNNLTEIATEILEKRGNLLVINHDLILTEDMKTQLELEIRNLYSKYLKKVTGKGAQLINVFIKGKEIEIVLKETLTVLEESFLAIGQHYKNVEFLRKAIYENTISEVEQQISVLIKRKVTIKKIDVYPKERFERILFQVL